MTAPGALETPVNVGDMRDPRAVLAVLTANRDLGQGPAIKAVRARWGIKTNARTVQVIRHAVHARSLDKHPDALNWRWYFQIAAGIQGYTPDGQDEWDRDEQVSSWVDHHYTRRGER